MKIKKMALLAYLVSGTVFMIGYFIKQFFTSSVMGSIVQYFGGPAGFFVTQYLEGIYKNYRFNSLAQEILIKYLRDIDISIKENVLDIEDQINLENFLDYTFISSQTNFELNNDKKNIYVNQSLIESVYEDLKRNFEIVKFAGLVIGDIGVGKTTLINELLKLPEDKKGLTETLTGESVTLGDPIKYNNPNYYPWLMLYDTQGFDKDTNFFDSIDNMKNYIESKFKCNGNEFVNFILYCIHGERFTKTEKENLIKLHNLYPSSSKLPIIVVNTRGLNENAESLLHKIELDMKNNFGIKDLIYIAVSAKKSSYNKKEFPIKNVDKLMNIISNFTESSLKSTLYKLFFEKIKMLHEKNMEYFIHQIDLKNISNFDENYKLIMKKCLNVNVSESTLNTMKTHYFKILEKPEIEENSNANSNKLRVEFEEKTNQLIKKELLEKYKQIYITRISEHAKNGTIILMKKLLNEDFIFRDILTHLKNSHKIELYIDKLITNFKKLNKLK